MGRKLKNRETDDILLVERNTGEVIGTIGNGDRIIRQEQLEFTRNYDTNFGYKKNFVKIFEDSHKEISNRLTVGEKAFLWEIMPFISYKDGVLREGQKTLTISMIAKIFGMSYEAVRKYVATLTKKGVLGEHKTGSLKTPDIINKCITTNPFIICRGNTMNKTIIDFYSKSDIGWNKVKKDDLL